MSVCCYCAAWEHVTYLVHAPALEQANTLCYKVLVTL